MIKFFTKIPNSSKYTLKIIQESVPFLTSIAAVKSIDELGKLIIQLNKKLE